jgi:signal transduction histidine kinase
VLRLEETDQLVPPVEPLKIPSAAATEFIESGDDQLVTAIRDPDMLPRQTKKDRRSPESIEMDSLQGQLSKTRQLAETGAVCNSILPEAHVRLSELRENLRQSVGDGISSVDPYPILASVDSVLSVLDQILDSAGTGPRRQERPQEKPKRQEKPRREEKPALRRVVEQAIKRTSAEFASRGVKFLAEIPEALRVVGDADLLIKAVAWLLNRAGRVSPSGNPVQIIATRRGGEAVLTVSYLGREQHDVGEGRISNRFRSAQEIISSVGGTLTVESKPNVGSTVRVTLPIA